MSFRSPKSPTSSLSSSLKRSDSLNLLDKKNAISFDDYEGSEFEFNADNEETSKKHNQTHQTSLKLNDYKYEATTSSSKGLPPKSVLRDAQSKEEGQIRAYHYASMNAYSKHKKLVNDYIRYYSGGKTLEEVFKRDTSKDKTDLDVIRENQKFIWEDDDKVDTWEKRLAKKYYDKLFKEYCICDLTLFKQNKIAMRWRIEKEVIEGKSQFICGDKRCQSSDSLKSWEVNFGYIEHNEKKNALVKLRLCPDCSNKLNYHHKRKEVIKPVKNKPEISNETAEKRKADSSESSSSDDEDEIAKIKKVKTNLEENKSETIKQTKPEESVVTEGNMIILNADDSLWKKSSEKTNALFDEKKLREDQFENYLEDLFF